MATQCAQLRPQRALGGRIAAQVGQRPGGHQGLCRRVARVATGRAQQRHLQTVGQTNAATPLRRSCRMCIRGTRLGRRSRRRATRRRYSSRSRLRDTRRTHWRRYRCVVNHVNRRRQGIGCVAIQIHGVPHRLQARHLQVRPHRFVRWLAHGRRLMEARGHAANAATATSSGRTTHTARRSPAATAPGRSPTARSPPWQPPVPETAHGRHAGHARRP